ncbi:putative cysteine-rich with EGF-like domain protein 2 [Apostichopus japonicus]|uniref:protein disulfide-isomerase n=1 Tax=Stichopus japonicus TaxID=307972 RepID=A0A2G8JP78_STIJA|nr:putative cysteine-rich with EGF-like domain protein 2 [Apostichopus japonicus]
MEVRLTWIQRFLTSFALLSFLNLSNGKPNIEKRCSTCREITKSFNEGIDRTARYNFEGGDADWEEKKLGSYSTSETRFIEILETLCKRSEYECNVFVEEAEELLEEWWSNLDRDNDDFERWLCIEKALVCCPKNQYGPDCNDCTGGIERPCSGNGACKGAGTRGGNGKCKCHGGYKGDLCDVCKKGFYEAHKNESDILCVACDTSCASTCSGPGPIACTKCKGGYQWDDENGCHDVDECKPDPETFPCAKEQYCENTVGSYTCGNCDIACTECLGPGNDKCVACRTGFNMVDNTCHDTDECENNPCQNVEHMECSNSPGSYFCECEEGYISDGQICVDKSVYGEESKDEASDQVNSDQEPNTEEEAEADTPDMSHDDRQPAGQDPLDNTPEDIAMDTGSNEPIQEENNQSNSDQKEDVIKLQENLKSERDNFEPSSQIHLTSH